MKIISASSFINSTVRLMAICSESRQISPAAKATAQEGDLGSGDRCNSPRRSLAFRGVAKQFQILAFIILAFVLNQDSIFAQPSPPSRPILFLHGWCGSPYDWQPLYSYLADALPPSMYPNPNVYLIQFNSDTGGYSVYLEKTPFTDPSNLQPLSLSDIASIPSSTRFFVIQFYDPNPSSTAPTDPLNVTRVSVLNKAYETKEVIELIKSITESTGVNIVSFSMGGLVARTYVENLASVGQCYNYQDNSIDPTYGSDPDYSASTCIPGSANAAYANDVANIITVDTPHQGTPLGGGVLYGTPVGTILVSTGNTCQAVSSTNIMELGTISENGPGLIEALNYQGNIGSGTKASRNTVPIQAIQNYLDPIDPWTGITAYSDQIVPLDSQAVPSSLSNGNVNVAPILSTYFAHSQTDADFLSNYSYCDAGGVPTLPMLHSMKCIGALTGPRTQIEQQLEKNNWLWVTSWTNSEASIPLDQGVTIEYSAIDYGNSTLSTVRLWRAPDNNGVPGAWVLMPETPNPGSALTGGTFTDKPSVAGTYWYDVDVLDSLNNEAREPLWFQVTFTPASTYGLTVATTGSGTVTSSDGYINCGSSCTHAYTSGTSVTLNAVPLSGWNFSGWSGACSGVGSCTVTVNSAASVTAAFSQNASSYGLTVTTTGSGTVTSSDGYINCGSSCSHTYSSGDSVTLYAAPASGWSFSSWAGACFGAGSCTLTMNAARATSAAFIQNAANNIPVVVTSAPGAITTNSATLNGTVNPSGLDTHYYFLYGTSSTFSGAYSTPSMDLGHGTTSTSVSAQISGLSGGTLYYCKLVATNSAGPANGGAISFATTSTSQAPTVTTGSAGSVTASSATLAGTINPNGADTHYWFLYGTSSSLSGATQTQSVDLGAGTIAYSISANILGLSAGTKYFYQLVASNGTGTGYGNTYSFTTPSQSAQLPTVTTGAANATINSATLSGTVNPNGGATTYWFIYSLSSTLSGATNAGSYYIPAGTSTQSVTVNIPGLSSGTIYYYQLQAQNSAGLSSGSTLAFQTSGSTKSAASVNVSPSPGSVTAAQPLPVTVTVTGTSGGPIPTGTVTLLGGNFTSGPISLNNGSVTITIPAGELPAGSDQLTAMYPGDGNYNGQTGSDIVIVGATGTNLVEPVGTTSATQTTTILFSNGFTLGSINVLTQGAPNLDFAIASGGSCAVGTTYTAGQTCTVNYTFTPIAPWQRVGAIVIEDGSGDVQATQYIAGTGTGPQMVMYPGTGAWILSSANNLSGIGMDANGSLYLADPVHNQVLKETPSGSTYALGTIGSGLSSPEGVAVDAGGNVYIADTSNNRILKETPFGGTYTQSTVASGLNLPFGVVVDGSGNVYVADTFNNRVLKETLSGNGYVQSTVASGSLSSPEYVAVDDAGSVYVVDTSNSRVLKETPLSNGNYTQSTVTSGLTAPQGATAIQGIAVDGGGDVYVANGGASRVLRETLLGGSYMESVLSGIGFLPGGIAIDSRGNLYIPSNANGGVWKVDVSESWYLINFATTAVGSTSSDSPQTVTAWNIGNGALTFPIPSSGNDPSISASFSLNSTGGTACPVTNSTASSAGTLAAETSCALPISFVPTSGGGNSGLLRLVDDNLNVPNSTQEITLSGTGTGTATLRSIAVTPTSSSVPTGNNQQFTAVGIYSDSSTQDLTGTVGWISGNTGVATIGPSGIATSVGAGSVSITATLNSVISNAAVLTITAPVTLTSITITPASSTIGVGSTQQFIATGTYSDSSTQDLTGTASWTSTNTATATIAASGLATAVAGGNTNISASLSGVNSNMAVLAVNPGAYVAPTEPVGTSSGTQTATIPLSSSFTLASINVVTQGAPNLDFNIASGGTCTVGTAYSAGQACTVEFTFTPKAPGLRIGAILLLDGGGFVNATEYISGTGTGPQVSFFPGGQSIIGGGFISPTGVATNASGDVFVADYGNNAVEQLLALGGYVNSIFHTGFNTPTGVAVDSAGNVFVADSGSNSVKEILVASGSAPYKTLSGTYNAPSAVAVDGAGNVFVADSGNNAVKEVLAASGYTTVSTLGSGFIAPKGIAIDGAGNLFVGDTGNHVVKEITKASGYTQVEQLGNVFNTPMGIAMDPSGNVFVADSSNNAVDEILVASGYTKVNPLGSGFNAPTSVTVDPSGNIFVADSLNDHVVKLDLADAPSLSFASTPVGATSSDSPKTATLANSGNVPLTFPIPASGNNPSISTNFSLDSSGATACPLIGSTASSPGALAVGASCTLPISFSPTSVGSISGSLVLTDNNMNTTNATQSILLNGTGTGGSISTTTNLSSSVNPSYYGQSVTITATVASTSGTATPTGSVQFSVDGNPVGSAVTLNGGTATYVTSTLIAGTHSFTAVYSPLAGSVFGTSSAIALSQVVNRATPTINWATPAAITYGTALSATQLNATATYNGSSVAGTFGYTPILGTVPIAGTQTLSVTFTPTDSTNYLTTTGTVQLTVTKATPRITVTPSASSITTAQTLSVTVGVSGSSGTATPTGTVTLTSGGYSSGATTLSAGSVTITIPAGSLNAGTDALTASYSPDSSSSSTYNSGIGSNSVTVTTAVNPSFTISGTAVTVSRGATTGNTSTFTVTPTGGFTGAVALTAEVTSSPAGAQYPPILSFGSTSPVNIAGATAGTATLTISTTAATSAALSYPKRPTFHLYTVGGAALACMLLFGIPARRRRWRTMLGMSLFLVVLTGGLVACSGGAIKGGGGGTGNPGTSAGSYTITVTGTLGSTTTTGTVALTVQ